MAIREDNNHRTQPHAPFIPLNAAVAGLALALAFIAAQSPFF